LIQKLNKMILRFFPLILLLALGADRQFCNTERIVQISQTAPNITETCGSACPVGTGLEFRWTCGIELEYDWRAIPLFCYSGCFYPDGKDLNTFTSAFDQCVAKHESEGLLPEELVGKSMAFWLCSSECYLRSKAFGGDCESCISDSPPAYDSISGNKCWWCTDTEWCASNHDSDCWGETRGWGNSICEARLSFISIYGWVIGGSVIASFLVFIILWCTTEPHVIVDHEKDAKEAIERELYDQSGHAVTPYAKPALASFNSSRIRSHTTGSLPVPQMNDDLPPVQDLGSRVLSHDSGKARAKQTPREGDATGETGASKRHSWTANSREKAASVALDDNSTRQVL